MLDFTRMFHVGALVDDLDAAMADLDNAGVEWAAPRRIDAMPFWTPESGSGSAPLRFVYSREGPQHVELLESPPGSPWHAGERAGIHHVGCWTNDVPAAVGAALDLGWSLVLANAAPEDGFGMLAYVQPSSGLLVEFVSDEFLPSFEEWWREG
jgi:lactoylglutathione lyase